MAMTRAEFDAWMDRRCEEIEERMRSPEFVEESNREFRDRLRRHGWTEERIAAWEATGWDERADSLGLPGGFTGAEADIEANYPGGLAAFRRDEPVDRTPHHKGEIAEY